ncbi:MAG: acetate--CoA ligase family protein [Deltaproteobacteria bacterium]|nr:acetate--CoA ligase family protein [Deltaproteobacteria bacterium]MBW2128177.1 acetate--CoA ligase family protein [Deltaproteobacteria bacterium]
MEIIDQAVREGRKTLSEYESKQLLARYGIPVTRERLVVNEEDLQEALEEIGFPLVLKACSPEISHKTEKGLVQIDIRNKTEALETFDRIRSAVEDTEVPVLVQEMIRGERELAMGMTRDPQFGPCVMFGLGGIFTEILKDTSFRVAPLERRDAMEMMEEIRAHRILGAVRGMEAADREILADALIALGKIGLENDEVKEIDVNPIILAGRQPVAVDALVVL